MLLFTQFVRISTRRIKSLSVDFRDLQSRFVTLFRGHLALRRRYLDLERICINSRITAKRLEGCLERAQVANESLVLEKEHLTKARESVSEELRSAQALSWTVVSRYDALQTTHSELLVQMNKLRSDCRGFRDDLRQVASQVQETFEVTELGLNDLQKSADPHLLKFKQDLLKIGHRLDLLRLNVTELLTTMTIACAQHNDGVTSPGAPPAYTPGSLEDAMRKLKTLSEVTRNPNGLRSVPPYGLYCACN